MITKLLQITDAAIGTALPVTTRHIYASLQGGQPVVHTGGGNFTPIANDLSGHWSYQRLRGEVGAVRTTLAGDPCEALQMTVPLRIVALLDRDGCIDVAAQVVAALRGSKAQIVAATQAASVAFDRIAWTFDAGVGQEFTPAPAIPTQRTLLVVDATIIVRGKTSCMVDCTPVDVTCAIIAAATLDKIRECLGDRLAELCDIPVGPCDPLAWELRNSEGDLLDSGTVDEPCGAELEVTAPDAIVLVNGEPFDTVPSGGTIDVPCEGGPCDPLTINFDGALLQTVTDPCGETVDIDCDTPVLGGGLFITSGALTGQMLPSNDFTGFTATYQEQQTPGTQMYRLGDFILLSYGSQNWYLVQAPSSDLYINFEPGGELSNPWDLDPSQWLDLAGGGATPTIQQATIGGLCCTTPEPCPTLCELIGEVEPENIGTDVLDCFDEAQTEAAVAILCDAPEPCLVTVRIYKNEELLEEVEDLDPCENHTINVTCDGDD